VQFHTIKEVCNMEKTGVESEPTLDSLLAKLGIGETESGAPSSSHPPQQEVVDPPQDAMVLLEKHFAPHDVMKLVATFLLVARPEGNDNSRVVVPVLSLSPDAALSLLVRLASANPDRYLKAASCAVRDEALRFETSTDSIAVPEGLLFMVGEQLKSSDTQLAQNSIDTLVSFCKTCSGIKMEEVVALVSDQLQEARSMVAAQRREASLTCVRCLAALVDIACISGASMALVEPRLVDLLDLLQDDTDPLLQMSVLDLYEKLAATEPVHSERATWIYQHARHVVMLAGGVMDVPPDPMLGGFALRVVATVCRLMQTHSLLDKDLMQSFLSALHNNINSGAMDRMAFVVAISAFASSSDDALYRVLQDEEARQAWLHLSVAQPKLKAAILVSVAGVIETTTLSRDLAMKLYAFVGQSDGPDTTEILMKLVLSPMSEVRIGAYTLFRVVAACLPTGSQVLLSHSGFFEMIMDREKETSKDGRDARYEVVGAILGSPVVSLLAEDIVKRMESFRREGPHYVKPLQWDVMEQ
jgi:Proteasome non-ATPase 26S subunit